MIVMRTLGREEGPNSQIFLFLFPLGDRRALYKISEQLGEEDKGLT